MTDSAKARAPILAAGGILLREGSRPRIAVVRLRRDKSWVLPKGKLYPGEQAVVGSMSYAVDGNIKIVQFWHMRAVGGPVRELMYDIKAVKWLSLKQAIETLTRAHEKVFLANVGPIALRAAKQHARDKSIKRLVRNGSRRRDRSAAVASAEYSHAAG